MGYQTCNIHGIRHKDDNKCHFCIDSNTALQNALEHKEVTQKPSLKRPRWTNEESVCECCGQRFIDHTRVFQTIDDLWTGVLARYIVVGVCPTCFEKYDK